MTEKFCFKSTIMGKGRAVYDYLTITAATVVVLLLFDSVIQGPYSLAATGIVSNSMNYFTR